MKIKYLKKVPQSRLRDYIYGLLESNTPISVSELSQNPDNIPELTNPKTGHGYARTSIYFHIKNYIEEQEVKQNG